MNIRWLLGAFFLSKATRILFIFFLSGVSLLVGSSASSIAYNSHHINYSYLSVFDSKKNSQNDDSSAADVTVTKKIKRNKLDINLISNEFHKKTIKDEFATSYDDKFSDDLILGQKQTELTEPLSELFLFLKQIDGSNFQTHAMFLQDLNLINEPSKTTIVDGGNYIVILLSISSLGFLVYYRQTKNTKKILSSSLVVLIVCSAVLTPVSISFNNYIPSDMIPLASADDGSDQGNGHGNGHGNDDNGDDDNCNDNNDDNKKSHDHGNGHNDCVSCIVPTSIASPIAVVLSGNRIALSWALTSDLTNPILGYQINYTTNNNNATWTAIVSNTNSTTTSYIISGLNTGTSYNFRIEAINECGLSPAGASSSDVIAGDIPSQVTGLSSIAVSSSQINLSWTTPNANGYSINGYKIERSTDGVTFSTIVANTTTNTNSYSNTGLSSNTLYYYRVSAINILGTGSSSSTSASITIPLPPTNIASTTVSTSQINLSWTAPSGIINGYKIERSTDGVTFSTIVANTTTSATTYSNSGLSSGTLYYYRVSALGSGGTSNSSSITSVTTSPTPPTNLLSSSISTSQINLSWTAPSGIINGYKIERSTDGVNFSTIVANTTTNTTTYSDNTTLPNTVYSYRVTSLGINGVSSSPSGTTSISSIATPPTNLQITSLAGLKTLISWTAPSGTSQILGYQIERSTNGSNWSILVANNNDGTNYQDSGLVLGETYFYRVSAINSGGTSSSSVASSAAIAGDVPSSVLAPAITIFSGGIMNMTWNAPLANSFAITSYQIDDSINNGTTYSTFSTVTGNPPSTHFLASGLIPGVTYQWRIEAINILGTSSSGTSSSPTIALNPLKIEARSVSGMLTLGATYTITPNPNGQSTPAIVIDGGSGDGDGILNGIVSISMIPFGTYDINMTTIPAGYNVLGVSTTYTEGPTQINGKITFRLLSDTVDKSTMKNTIITTQPSLNNTVLNTWSSTFHATKVNITSSTISSVGQLPPILSAGSSNATAIAQAVSNQATVQLNTTFSSSTSSLNIIKTLGVPEYSMPQFSNLVSVIPTIATTNDVHNGQIITTPPLSVIVPGQSMVIPVQDSVISNSGGLKQISVQSSNTSSSIGDPQSDWFVIRTNKTLPSSLPSLPNTINKTTLFVNVTYPFESTGKGFNWGDPSNFAQLPTMTLTIPKPGSGVPIDSNGCAQSAIFVYDPQANSWTTNPVTILSTTPSAGNSNTCDVLVQAPHFSQFAIGTINPVTSSGGENSPVHPFVSSYKFSTILSEGKTSIAQIGKPTQLEFNITAQSGANYIQHVALYTNLHDQLRTISDSNTYVIYEPGQPLEISNTQGLLSGANVLAVSKGNNLDITFNMTFAKAMDTSDVIVRSWDQRRASFDNVFADALKVVDVPTSNSSSLSTKENQTITQVMSTPSLNIPDWVKLRTDSWSKGKISDSDFVFEIKYLVGNSSNNIPYNNTGHSSSYIPSWFKNNANWWGTKQISDWDFVSGLRYLVDKEIIVIK